MKLFGYNINVEKVKPAGDPLAPQAVSSRAKANEGLEILKRYAGDSQSLDNRILENERWYRSRYWDMINAKGKKESNRPEPVSSFLFNILANKHADAMDNYPKPTLLPQERDDEQEAARLSEVVPIILDRNNHRKTYSDAWWYKLKHGFVIKGVLWDEDKTNGLGDLELPYIDKLHMFWQPGITDLQKSRNLFVCNLEDDDDLKELYPGIRITSDKPITLQEYADNPTSGTILENKTLVTDWYYKRRTEDGRTLVHLIKMVGAEVIYASEDDPDKADVGMYEDGRYPFLIDVLFPEEGTVTGFGFVDIAKNPQIYIDKMDQIITENALMAGKKRWFRKRGGNVNMQQFMDWNQPIVDVEGGIDETNMREIKVEPLPASIPAHRQVKVQELKDVTSNDVFNSGEGGKGVTAASAIYALQEAGNKVSRDMIGMTYNTFRQEMSMVVSRVRQFYNVPRPFRIDRPDGSREFVTYDNRNMQPQQYPEMYPGEEPKWRAPEFDIQIGAEKSNPYSTMLMNEMGQAMFTAGFFNPQMAESALVALEMMQFEGKEKIAEMVRQNSMMMQQMQQMQAALVTLAGQTGMLQPQGQQAGAMAGGMPNGAR